MYFYLFLLCMSVIITLRIYHIQNIWETDPEFEKEFLPSKRLKETPPHEGSILDVNGNILAISTPLYDIYMDCCVLKKEFAKDEKKGKEKEDEWCLKAEKLAGGLARTLPKEGKDSTYYSKLIKTSRESGRKHVSIVKGVDHRKLEELKKLPLFEEGQNRGGLIVEPQRNRMHPYENLAGRILGYINPNNPDNYYVGIEGAYHHEIKGKTGMRWARHTDNFQLISDIDSTNVEAQDGLDVRTTLDIHIQDMLDRALRKYVDTVRHINSACAVIMDVETGGVRAMVNLTRGSDGKMSETYNIAVGRASEPGSIFKTVMLTTLLEDGHVQLEDKMRIHRDNMLYPGFDEPSEDKYAFSYKTRHKTDYIPVIDGFMISSNYVFRRQVSDHYYKNPEELVARLHSYNLGGSFNFEINEKGSKPSIPVPYSREWSESTIPSMAIGYSVKVTPLQILSFYNGLANKGKMMKPYIVESLEKDGQVVDRREPEIMSIICSEATADTMVRAMVKVTRRIPGYAPGIYTKGTAYDSMRGAKCTIAGKTGTAWTYLEGADAIGSKDGYKAADGRYKYQGSFAGFFPAEDPKYSIIVTLYTNLTIHSEGGGDKPAKVVKEVVNEIWAYDQMWQKDVTAKTEMPKLNDEHKSTQEKDGVPDLTGLGLRDAIRLVENFGFKCEYTGVGHVVKQEKKGETIKITLK